MKHDGVKKQQQNKKDKMSMDDQTHKEGKIVDVMCRRRWKNPGPCPVALH